VQGWGFKDSGFLLDRKENVIKIKGTRYMFGGQGLPGFLPFLENEVNVNTKYDSEK